MVKNVLVIDCCVRGAESRTLRLAQRYLDTLEDAQITYKRLYELNLAPLSLEETVERKNIALAEELAQADEIVVAAPFWDLSFPAVLKLYLEHVCITGVTFHYVGDQAEGLCRAKKAVYVSTAGGFVGEHHLGEEYVKAVFQNLFGIPEFHAIRCEGLDLGGDPWKLVAQATL